MEEPTNAIEETPRESSPIPSQVQALDIPASSSNIAITKEELLNIVNSMFEDLKEYVYESQRETIKEMQSFKEETLSLQSPYNSTLMNNLSNFKRFRMM